MAATDLRRRPRHYPVGWKVAVEFNAEDRKQVIQTEIRDLSTMGAAILTDDRDLTGTVVKLLLLHPGQTAAERQAPLKIRARVVSSARTPGMAQYRHGLSFIRLPFDGLDDLEKILRAAGPDVRRKEPVAVIASSQDGVAARRGRLAQLRQLADAKRAEAKAPDPRDEIDASISEALRVAHRYLKDLAEQLNVIHPVYQKGYAIPGVPEFKRLTWEEGKADFRMREITPILKHYDRVSFRFRLSGKKEIKITREYPANEKLKQFLDECRIPFTAHEIYNARGAIQGSKFIFPCEVKASVLLYSELDIGKLLLRASNVSGFGALNQILSPDAINEESLDELTGFILGESKGPGPLLLRSA
ncbi:MAG: PilZ domain-containing protein [Burkholderiales bacterium]